jgi:hypothetical protein
MAETPYLVDSNVLLRWVTSEHSDYAVTVSAMDALLRQDAVLCYTSQNVAEFWTPAPAPSIATAMAFPLKTRTTPQDLSKRGSDCSRTALPFTKSGVASWWRTASQACGFTTRAWLPQCMCTGSSTFSRSTARIFRDTPISKPCTLAAFLQTEFRSALIRFGDSYL